MASIFKNSVIGLALACIAPMTLPAQNIQFDLVDTGVLQHPDIGTGKKMRVKVTGALPSDLPEALFKRLCDDFDEHVVPYVLANVRNLSADFVGVRIISGVVFGSYKFVAFDLINDHCGEPL